MAGKKRMGGNAMSTCGNPLFTSLQISETKTRWESFAVSYSVQALGLVALIVFSILAPKIAPPLMANMELVAPNLDPMPMAKAAPVKPVVRPMVKVLPVVKVQPVKPVLVAPQIAKIEAPVPQVHLPQRVQPIAPVAEVAQPKAVPGPRFDSKVITALPGPKVAPRSSPPIPFRKAARPRRPCPRFPPARFRPAASAIPTEFPSTTTAATIPTSRRQVRSIFPRVPATVTEPAEPQAFAVRSPAPASAMAQPFRAAADAAATPLRPTSRPPASVPRKLLLPAPTRRVRSQT